MPSTNWLRKPSAARWRAISTPGSQPLLRCCVDGIVLSAVYFCLDCRCCLLHSSPCPGRLRRAHWFAELLRSAAAVEHTRLVLARSARNELIMLYLYILTQRSCNIQQIPVLWWMLHALPNPTVGSITAYLRCTFIIFLIHKIQSAYLSDVFFL